MFQRQHDYAVATSADPTMITHTHTRNRHPGIHTHTPIQIHEIDGGSRESCLRIFEGRREGGVGI